MSEQRWADNWSDHDGDVASEPEVRHVQPYQAVKSYRCPGCEQVIPPGLGHKVVVPLESPVDRRHWHTGCWSRAERQRR